MPATRAEIIAWCDETLGAGRVRDAAVNGLQVAGAEEVHRIATAVSASARTIGDAVDWGADTLLVHHGLLWGDRLRPITGLLAARLRPLLVHNFNLVAYHLPLDAHQELGNNAQLAQRLGLRVVRGFDELDGVPIGLIAAPPVPRTPSQLAGELAELVGRVPLVLGDDRPTTTIAVLSGSGYSALAEAAALGAGALITGDVRESTMAEARELGIAVVAAGHEATERWGIQALGRRLAERFDIETVFLHDPNPV